MNKILVVVVATLNRQREIARLIKSLVPSAPALAGIIVVDNGGSLQLDQVLADCPLSIEICRSQQNLGCGGGLSLGMKTALEKCGGKITHFLPALGLCDGCVHDHRGTREVWPVRSCDRSDDPISHSGTFSANRTTLGAKAAIGAERSRGGRVEKDAHELASDADARVGVWSRADSGLRRIQDRQSRGK